MRKLSVIKELERALLKVEKTSDKEEVVVILLTDSGQDAAQGVGRSSIRVLG